MNPNVTPLPWQQELWLDLTAQALGGGLGHALLLAGPPGLGKRRFAIALAAFLLCEARTGHACGQCRSCQQLAIGSHPNADLVCLDGDLGLAATADGRHDMQLVHWEPSRESKRQEVPIGAARNVIDRFHLTSHYGQTRVALVDPADDMSVGTVNALLKTIEEPPADVHLLLVSERPQGLPPTLRSRCQRIRFAPPPPQVALGWLQGQGVKDAAAALEAASGAPLRAAQLAQARGLDQHREWAELWGSVALRKRDPVGAAGGVAREELPALLDWLQQWLAGQLRQALAGAGGWPAPTLAKMAEQALDARRRLDGNAQPQMLLEALLVEWARLTRPAAGAAA